MAKPPDTISDRLIGLVGRRLAENKRVRRRLPDGGRLHIDRQLPFLCLYRQPKMGADQGTEKLVTTEASYLLGSTLARQRPGLAALAGQVVRTVGPLFGAFLVLEIRAVPADRFGLGPEDGPAPAFRLRATRDESIDGPVAVLEKSLRSIRLQKRRALVEVVRSRSVSRGRLSPLISVADAAELNCHQLVLEINPVYRDPESGLEYPLVLRALRRQLSRALQRTFFEFSRSCTSHRPRHFHVLGRHAVVKSVWQVDRLLAEVAEQFDLLVQATPINAAAAWNAFRRSRFQKAPVFRYRPVPVDPSVIKRRLYDIPVERVEDPTLARIFRQKQDELDRQITMLGDLDTVRFRYGGLQLYGRVDDGLSALAAEILDRLPPRSRDDAGGGRLDAEAFARLARQEIARYREQYPDFTAGVEVRRDMGNGLMVSGGSLMVGAGTSIPTSRAEALLQHEIGTHSLTWHNGRAQPLRLLSAGLAGYEALQEGLAVLAEHLVGGLSRPRLRLLAARVLAVRQMVDGAGFIENFRVIHDEQKLEQRAAFTLVMRVHRGGGLSKDAIYLRGLAELLDYLAGGGELAPLYLGKIAAGHIPIVRELTLRGVLRTPPLEPVFISRPGTAERLAKLRDGLSVTDLVERTKK